MIKINNFKTNLFMFFGLITFLLFINFNNAIGVKANPCSDGGKCGISADSGATGKTYNDMVTSHEKMTTSGDRSYVRLRNEDTGKDIYLFNSEEERDKMVNCGLLVGCLDSSETALLSDLGLPNADMYDENTLGNFTNSVNQLKKDFVKQGENGTVTINPDSDSSDFYRYIYGDDLDAAAELLKEKGNISNWTFYPGYLMWDSDTGYVFLDGSTTDQYKSWCSKYEQQTKMCDAVNETSGYFNDEGCMTPQQHQSCEEKKIADGVSPNQAAKDCCIENGGTEWGSCCLLFHSSEECFKGDKPSDEPELPPSTCKYEPVIPKMGQSPSRGESEESGGTCGSTYTSIQFDYSETIGGGLVDIETRTYTSIQLPSIKSNVLAGQGFNWNDITSNKTVTKRVHDTTRLDYEIDSANAIIINNQKQIDYNTCLIGTKNDEIDDVKKAWDDEYDECDFNCGSCDNLSAEEEAECHDCEDRERICKSNIDDKYYQDKIADLKYDISKMNELIKQLKNNPAVAKANDYLKILNGYKAEKENYGIKNYVYNDTASSSNENMIIGDYKQKMNSIVAIAKNSGLPLTKNEVNNINNQSYISNSYDFFIPSFIQKGSAGYVSRTVSDSDVSFSYQCDLNINNYIRCGKDDCKNGLNVIFRPISLTNPFPNIKTSNVSRKFGANWNQTLSNTYIANNRSVSDYDVYNLTPIYTIVLTPSTIREIRQYNKGKEYNNFDDMECTDGYKCYSKFLWNDFYKIIDVGNSCATSSGWDAC